MNNHKTVKVVYWITTGLLAAFLLIGVIFINSPEAKEGIAHMQVPQWLALEVGYGQPLGALLLLLPFTGKRLKEWAYVALGSVFISAFIGHLYLDGFGSEAGMALILFGVLLASYICYHKIQSSKR